MSEQNLYQKIYARDKYICQYCGKDGLESFDSWYFMTIDHFNGNPEDNIESNLKTACRFCNEQKSNKKFSSMDEARAFLIGSKIKKINEEFLMRKIERGS